MFVYTTQPVVNPVVKPGLTTGCIVYTNIQPVIKLVVQPVRQPVLSCKRGLTYTTFCRPFLNRRRASVNEAAPLLKSRCWIHRRQPVYNIMGVHENGEDQRVEVWGRKGRRAKLEGPIGVEFLWRGCSPPHRLGDLRKRCKLLQWGPGPGDLAI